MLSACRARDIIFCLAARIRPVEFLETTGRKIRHSGAPYCAPQCYERIEYHPVDFQALAECALARAKCPLGGNADVVDAGLPWRRLDALDQLCYLPLECVGSPKEVGPEGDEQIAVIALGIRVRTGEQSQRLHHERKPETFVAAERQQGAASCRRWIPGRLRSGRARPNPWARSHARQAIAQGNSSC